VYSIAGFGVFLNRPYRATEGQEGGHIMS